MNFRFALQCAFHVPVCAAAMTLMAPAASAQSSEELAKQLSNPVASLISVPIQYNYDNRFGNEREGHKNLVNIQPVVPISINADWNVISRTIIPLVDQKLPESDTSGVGDIVQSLFFSPKAPTAGGLIWGVGPVFLLPTGSNGQLSARKWGAGPTAVALKQDGPWTYGALFNHIWGAGGDSQRPNLSSTFVQPFLTYTTPGALTYSLNTESTYDWKSEQWSVPVNLGLYQVTKFGSQLVSIGGGVRYWADSPANGPHGWGLRMQLTFLFPK